jgi:hypothetical protein
LPVCADISIHTNENHALCAQFISEPKHAFARGITTSACTTLSPSVEATQCLCWNILACSPFWEHCKRVLRCSSPLCQAPAW